jgi:hypothetical protein
VKNKLVVEQVHVDGDPGGALAERVLRVYGHHAGVHFWELEKYLKKLKKLG